MLARCHGCSTLCSPGSYFEMPLAAQSDGPKRQQAVRHRATSLWSFRCSKVIPFSSSHRCFNSNAAHVTRSPSTLFSVKHKLTVAYFRMMSARSSAIRVSMSFFMSISAERREQRDSDDGCGRRMSSARRTRSGRHR